jgi:hypothetical protein
VNTKELIELALEQTCPAGKPWTGDAPEEDHGHTSCWMIHQLIEKIVELESESEKLAGILMGPYVNVNESYVATVDETLKSRIGGTNG